MASAITLATCSASRPVPSAIWCRQEKPSAATTVSAAALRTAGSSDSSPIAIEVVIGVGAIAERARHAAAARLSTVSTLSPSTSDSAVLDRTHDAERFLVAMAVQQHSCGRASPLLATAGRDRPRDPSRRRSRAPGTPRTAPHCRASSPGLVAEPHRLMLVARCQHARRLQADDRHACVDERFRRSSNRSRLGPRLVDEPRRQERAAAARGSLRGR